MRGFETALAFGLANGFSLGELSRVFFILGLLLLVRGFDEGRCLIEPDFAL